MQRKVLWNFQLFPKFIATKYNSMSFYKPNCMVNWEKISGEVPSNPTFLGWLPSYTFIPSVIVSPHLPCHTSGIPGYMVIYVNDKAVSLTFRYPNTSVVSPSCKYIMVVAIGCFANCSHCTANLHFLNAQIMISFANNLVNPPNYWPTAWSVYISLA